MKIKQSRCDAIIRQHRILSILWCGRIVHVRDLKEIREDFGVHSKTIRRDLMVLESIPLYRIHCFDDHGTWAWKSDLRLPPEARPKLRYKRCQRCHVPKPVGDFWNSTLTSDGLQVNCKNCNRKDLLKWQRAHRAHVNMKNRLWRKRKKEREQQSGEIH